MLSMEAVLTLSALGESSKSVNEILSRDEVVMSSRCLRGIYAPLFSWNEKIEETEVDERNGWNFGPEF